jgi:hypothetical protein
MLDFLERESDQRLRFSTFHALWLCATLLREHYGLASADLMSLETSQRLIDSLQDWMPGISRVSNIACKTAFRRAENIGGEIDLRDFFRAAGELGKGVNPAVLLSEAFGQEVQIETESGRGPRANLPG